MTKYILIVAGGKGLRMGGELPKQFLPLDDGRPVLMHTIDAFIRYDNNIRVIVVLPSSQQEFWKELCEKHNYKIPLQIADGGETRFHSVRNGLELVTADGLVGVHDGVRPFVSQAVISSCFEKAGEYKAVIPVTSVVETIRKVADESSSTVDRNLYKLVQTPQVFDTELLKEAYKQPYSNSFTDDASVVEAAGHQVYLVDGNRENIKITTPFDLIIANALLQCTI